MDTAATVANLRNTFSSGKYLSYETRKSLLLQLKQKMIAMESEILSALQEDLGKSEFEGYSAELGFCLAEIGHTIKHLKKWMRPKRKWTPMAIMPASSKIVAQPRGVCLIIGPWNYPFQLIIAPLAAAISAGNCCVLKLSEYSPATNKVLQKLVSGLFDPNHVAIVEGGVPETSALLEQKFDHIFFTGSIPVGKIVMQAAAKHLTPVTLELGGKSPCIVERSANIDITARRLVWGKTYNAGQTCVAPDYLLVQNDVKDQLITRMKHYYQEFFGGEPADSPDYPRIIHDRHFDRLVKFIGEGEILMGGRHDKAKRFIDLTLLDKVNADASVMQEEIFGPVLPVMGFDSIDEAFSATASHPNPLAAYIFTSNKEIENRFLNLSFGGGCVNNMLIHLANPDLPFGGVGDSGIGAYHGHDSFKTFSHYKSILKTPFAMDLKVKYPPYKDKLWLVKKLIN